MNNLELIGVSYFKKGSGIHIKEKNKGKFTASAKAAGKSVQEHARDVLNDPNATPLQKKRANFARNAKAWKHQEGGLINPWIKIPVNNNPFPTVPLNGTPKEIADAFTAMMPKTKVPYRSPDYSYITNDNLTEEYGKFKKAFEGFHEKAYLDKKKKVPTVGTGLTYWRNPDGTEKRSVKLSDTITPEENQKQLDYTAIGHRNDIIKFGATNFDKYPPALKFQLYDAFFNVGVNNLRNKSPKYKAAIIEYEASKGYENPDYDLNKIYQHADWNRNDKGWLGIRSRMRQHPDRLNPNDYKKINLNHFRDSLRTVYN